MEQVLLKKAEPELKLDVVVLEEVPVEQALLVEAKPKEEQKPAKKAFTQEEIKFLMENKDKFTNEELAEKLGRSVDSVTHKLSRAGIARQSYEWTDDKDKFLMFRGEKNGI